MTALQDRVFPHGYFDVVRQVLLFFAAYNLYRIVRGQVDNQAGAALAFQHGREVISLERSLHLFVEPAVQDWVSAKPVLIDAASWLYINAQTTVTVGALVFLYMFHNKSFYFIRNMFMVAMFLAIIGYTLFPCAPPRMFPEWGFADSVSNFAHVDKDSSVNALFNPYAAVPSMHVCFALMIGQPLARLVKNRVGRIFWTLYPLLVLSVIVSTANHFLTDAVLGACVAAIAAYAARALALARPGVWAFSPAPARSGVTA